MNRLRAPHFCAHVGPVASWVRSGVAGGEMLAIGGVGEFLAHQA